MTYLAYALMAFAILTVPRHKRSGHSIGYLLASGCSWGLRWLAAAIPATASACSAAVFALASEFRAEWAREYRAQIEREVVLADKIEVRR